MSEFERIQSIKKLLMKSTMYLGTVHAQVVDQPSAIGW